MQTFEIEVNCSSGGTPHKHTLVVTPGGSGVYNASPPTKVRLQYACPATGDKLIAIFEPPVGAARPFEISKVT